VRYLVTGGAGFIGSNLVRHLLTERPTAEVVNLDLLTYAGNLASLEDVEHNPRYRFIHGDICDARIVGEAMRGTDVVFHLAAESHVDRSIVQDAPFVRTNVLGTATLLAAALAAGVRRFVQVSTDEVYGELPWRDPAVADPSAPRFTEETPLAPRSPYSASKAGGDHLALAYHATHGLDVVVTRCSNNYGPYQYPEKLIPVAITHALADRPVPVYGDGLYVRDWIHVEDHCRGLLAAAERGRAGRVYNFGADAERTNLALVRELLEVLGKPESLIEHVKDRPGHDRRYAIDASRARAELGWSPRVPFAEGLRETVAWYRTHGDWCRAVLARQNEAPRAHLQPRSQAHPQPSASET
jgi:dTDP-glucose 4,6-dehydratase